MRRTGSIAALAAALTTRTPLGWLQLRHERGRLLVALAGIAFADVLMFTQLGFSAALYDSNTRLNRAFRADLVLLGPRTQNMQSLSTFPRRRLLQARDVPGVIEAQPVSIGTLTWRNPQTQRNASVQVVGFDPDARVLDLAEVNEQAPILRQLDTLLLDRGARGAYDQVLARLGRGEAVTLEADRRTLTLAGTFRLGASFGADATALASDQTFLRLFPRRSPGSVNLGLLSLAEGTDPEAVARRLRQHLPGDVNVLTAKEYVAFEENYWRQASPIGVIFGLGTAMAFVVGVVIVFQVLSTDVHAHLREYATFRAMGFRNRWLFLVVLEQALVLSTLGFLPGMVLPLGLYAVMARATALPIAMTLERALLVFLLTLLMGVLSGAVATHRLREADPAELF